MQGAYEKEANALVSLKMQSISLGKRAPTRTGQQTTPYAAITHSTVYGNLRKFGATSSPEQCLHHCKVHMKGIGEPENANHGSVQKGICEDRPANYPLCWNYAHPRQWKFAQIWGCL